MTRSSRDVLKRPVSVGTSGQRIRAELLFVVSLLNGGDLAPHMYEYRVQYIFPGLGGGRDLFVYLFFNSVSIHSLSFSDESS